MWDRHFFCLFFFLIPMKPQNSSCINIANQYFSKAKHTKFRCCYSREICLSLTWLFVPIKVNSHFPGFSSVNFTWWPGRPVSCVRFMEYNDMLKNSMIMFLVLPSQKEKMNMVLIWNWVPWLGDPCKFFSLLWILPSYSLLDLETRVTI